MQRDQTVAPDHPPACKVALAPAERLIFDALRAWAGVRIAGRKPHEAVFDVLGAKVSRRTLGVFLSWVQAVEAGRRQPLRLTCAHCGGVATDAQRLIVACGVAPVEPLIAEALLEPILRDGELVMLLGRSLNAALAADGWRLPARLLEGDAPAPESPTLH